jgi:hypothetical protein
LKPGGFFDDGQDPFHDFFGGYSRGVDMPGIRSRTKRRQFPKRILFISLPDFLLDLLHLRRKTPFDPFPMAPASPFCHFGVQKKFEFRPGKNHRSGIPAFGYNLPFGADDSLQAHHGLADRTFHRYGRGHPSNLRLPNFGGYILSLADHSLSLFMFLEGNIQAPAQALQSPFVFRADSLLPGSKSHRPVHGPRVQIKVFEPLSQHFANRALAGACRAIDGDDLHFYVSSGRFHRVFSSMILIAHRAKKGKNFPNPENKNLRKC